MDYPASRKALPLRRGFPNDLSPSVSDIRKSSVSLRYIMYHIRSLSASASLCFLLFRAERQAGSGEENMQKRPQSDGQGRSAGAFSFFAIIFQACFAQPARACLRRSCRRRCSRHRLRKRRNCRRRSACRPSGPGSYCGPAARQAARSPGSAQYSRNWRKARLT